MGFPHLDNPDPMGTVKLIAFFVVPILLGALLGFWSRRVTRPRKTVLRVLAAISAASPFMMLGLFILAVS